MALVRAALLGAVLAAWEFLPRFEIVNPALLPPLSDVAATLWQLLQRSNVHEAIGVTAAEVAVAFVVAVPLGAALGVLIAESEYIGAVFKPLLFYVFSIPKSIFLPMFILVFGITFAQKVAYAGPALSIFEEKWQKIASTCPRAQQASLATLMTIAQRSKCGP